MIHILVLEDDLPLNQAVCKHLSRNGYQVDAATTEMQPLTCSTPTDTT